MMLDRRLEQPPVCSLSFLERGLHTDIARPLAKTGGRLLGWARNEDLLLRGE